MMSGQVRRITTAIAALGLLAPVASCSGTSAGPGAIVPPTRIEPSESTTPPTTDTPVPIWESNFSRADLAAYRRALARWEAYETSSEPIWSAGQATPEARELFAEYFIPVVAESAYRQLKDYAEVEVRIEGTPAVYWSKALRVSPVGDSVQIRQCVDFTTTRAIQYGDETPRDVKFEQPLLREIVLGRFPGQDWIIYAFDDLADEKVRACDPDAL